MSAPHGYVLGIDLGTSHTVAVVRWPDGRSRALLVDGAPVMPSSVFMDESGAFHVGRDAQRLAQTDPARYEPNPKHRIAEGTVLLGEHEVPTVDLLGAVLQNVAAKAVEAVGHLPPTVLTFPAKWGPQRRGVLEQAAAKAGFQQPRMVPEPVAAAHYFAEVMRQPIPQGGAVAVFDFGGGTLDVAVVRHDSDGRFSVLSDGGLEDLGGLDVDAALVRYLGQAIEQRVPETWRQLTQPTTGTDRRNRRLFWDDVRGAKEMLSRTAVAPVPVPGVEAALHMTRDELERLATPLLSRAVDETQRVIEGAGLSPQQLAGIFLVGGASRIPLVARLLHMKLGIAPTVLEQPELPVAEGSLAASFPQEEPVTPTPSPPTEPYTPPAHVSPPPPETTPESPRTPWYKRKTSWIATAAGVAAIALLVGWAMYDPYPQRDMQPLQQVGSDIAFPGSDDGPDVYQPDIDDETAYYLSQEDSDSVHVTAVDLVNGERLWDSPAINVEDASGIAAQNGIVYVVDRTTDGYRYTFLNPDNGDRASTVSFGSDDWTNIVNGQIVHYNPDGRVAAYDPAGEQRWQIDIGAELERGSYTKTWKQFTERRNHSVTGFDGTVWVLDSENEVSVIDLSEGEITAKRSMGTSDDIFEAYENVLFMADAEAGYTVSAYDMADDLTRLWTYKDDQAETEATGLAPCGEQRVCVTEERDDDAGTKGLTVLSVAENGSVVWKSPDGQMVAAASPAGENLLVTGSTEDDDVVSQMYDAEMNPVGGAVDRGMAHIDSGSFMTLPGEWDRPTDYGEDRTFVGLGAQTGQRYELGTLLVIPQCDATDVYLTCATIDGIRVWSFRY